MRVSPEKIGWITALFCSALVACSPATQSNVDSATKRQGVVVIEPPGQTIRVQVEVVQTPEDRRRGLMFRKSLAPFAGMLFIFDREERQSFWMRNTLIPLDMIFINEQRVIVGIVADAEPLTLTSRAVDQPSRFVLEVNGGFAVRHGITPGMNVAFNL